MSFAHIKGHNGQIETIKEWLKDAGASAGRGYLFSGPDGIGKKMVAWNFAKALNCGQSTADACNRCPSCLKIDKMQHPDVYFIGDNQTGAIKIEDIRYLKRNIALRPYEAKYKFFMIDNAHNITAEAGNALLKTLEEPVGNSVIILISSKPQLLFKTIVSRCRVLRFYPMPMASLKEILKQDYGIGDGPAHFLSFFAEGKLGFALNLKDKDILSKKNKIIDELTAARYGLSAGDREEMRDILSIISVWFRDIYLLKSGAEYSELINIDRRDELEKSASLYSRAVLDRVFDFISDSMSWIDQNVNGKLLLANLKYVLKNG